MQILPHRSLGSAAIVVGTALLTACASMPQAKGPYQGTTGDFVQIYQLFQKYNYDINIDDGDAWADDFTSDGVFQDPSNCAIGHKALSEVIGHHKTPGKDLKSFHFSMPGLITYVDESHATVHSNVVVVSETGAGKAGGIGITGSYDDKLSRVDGQWKFAYRFVQRPNKTAPIPCTPQIPNGFHYTEWP